MCVNTLVNGYEQKGLVMADEGNRVALFAMSRKAYEAVLERAVSERGDREKPYSALKWWGRRFRPLVRDLLAASVLDDDAPLIEGIRDEDIAPLARGKLVYDPFVGGGTILVEALRLGFDAVGVDIDPTAVEITREAIDLISGECERKYPCLIEALRRTEEKVRDLWVLGEDRIVHVFLAKCPPCEAPMWVATRRSRSEVALLTSEGIVWMSYGEAKREYGITPTHPKIRLPPGLPEAAEGFVAYAVEVVRGKKREVLPVRPGGDLAKALKESAERAKVRLGDLLGRYRAPIPSGLREVSRLTRDGITSLEQVFTWRQLLTLLTFVREAEALGCSRVARLAAGYVARTASLLAIYYQPYGKVNPALVIKSYWLPPYPVELNPVSYVEDRDCVKSIGRGTLATFIRRYRRACSREQEHASRRAKVVRADALGHVPGRRPYIIMTDPPYPGYQSYQELALLYRYFLHYPDPEKLREAMEAARNNPFLTKKSYTRFIKEFASKVMNTGPKITAVFLGISKVSDADLVATMAKELTRNHGYATIYWFPGEPPGKLGRSRARGVFVIVASSIIGSPNNPTTPLEWALNAVESMKEMVNADIERKIIKAVIEKFARELKAPINNE